MSASRAVEVEVEGAGRGGSKPVGPQCYSDLLPGQKVPQDSGSDPSKPPEWLDSAVYDPEQMKAFFDEHLISFTFIWHCSLVFGLCIESFLKPLIFTGQSATVALSLQRYMHTFAHLIEWHESDIFDPSSASYASVAQVRALHGGVAKAMDASMPGVTWISSYDMACVQTGFVGVVCTVADKFGMIASDEELTRYVNFWRCVARQLGLADKWNLCGSGHDVAANIVYELVQRVLVPNNQHPPPERELLMKNFIGFENEMCLPTTARSTVAFVYWAFGYDLPEMGLLDWALFYAMRLFAALTRRSRLARRVCGCAVRASLRKRLAALRLEAALQTEGAQGAAAGGCPYGAAEAAARGVCPMKPVASPEASAAAGKRRHAVFGRPCSPLGLLLWLGLWLLPIGVALLVLGVFGGLGSLLGSDSAGRSTALQWMPLRVDAS